MCRMTKSEDSISRSEMMGHDQRVDWLGATLGTDAEGMANVRSKKLLTATCVEPVRGVAGHGDPDLAHPDAVRGGVEWRRVAV